MVCCCVLGSNYCLYLCIVSELSAGSCVLLCSGFKLLFIYICILGQSKAVHYTLCRAVLRTVPTPHPSFNAVCNLYV